jgi:hypothetical protein
MRGFKVILSGYMDFGHSEVIELQTNIRKAGEYHQTVTAITGRVISILFKTRPPWRNTMSINLEYSMGGFGQ